MLDVLQGLQAARSADVAISQFRFLKKLLLVHGAWSYRRLSTLILCLYSVLARMLDYVNISLRFFLQEHRALYDTVLGMSSCHLTELCLTPRISTPSSTTSRVRLPTSLGLYRCTTSSSLFSLLLSSEFSTSSSPRGSSIGIHNCTFLAKRTSSSPKLHSGCGSQMLSIIVWQVASQHNRSIVLTCHRFFSAFPSFSSGEISSLQTGLTAGTGSGERRCTSRSSLQCLGKLLSFLSTS